MPDRLAFVLTELTPGGAERCATELALHFARLGSQVMVCSLRCMPQPDRRELVDRLSSAGVKLRFLGASKLWDFRRVVADLTKNLQEHQPEVLQSLLFHANIIGVSAGTAASVPVLVTGLRVADQRFRWRLWAERWLTRRARCHVCVSEAVRQFMIQRGRFPASKLMVIPNAVDLSRFHAATPTGSEDLGLAAGRRFVVSVGRLDPQKNLLWLIRHAWMWLSQLPFYDLILVGTGAQQSALQKEIDRQQRRHRQLAGRIRLLGFRRDIPNILAAADLLVLPSLWEGMPNVVLEAMAAGLPVLARPVEGIQELLGTPDQLSPQMVTSSEAEQWSNQLVNIISNYQLAAKLSQKNQQRAQELFGLPMMCGRYENLYRSLLAGPEATSSG